MTYEELKQFYEEHKEDIHSHAVKRTFFTEFRKSLWETFPFLKELSGRVELSTAIYCLVNDITDIPPCGWCGEKVKTARTGGFSKTCSRKCSGSLSIHEQREENLAKYGVEYHTQRPEVKRKSEVTSIENWGSRHFMQSEKGKEHHVNSVKAIYGDDVENVFQLGSVKEKSTNTHMRVRGVRHQMHCPEVKGKVVSTNMERRGVGNPMQCPEVQQKSKNTTLDNWDSEFWFTSEEGKKHLAELREKNGGKSPKQLHISQESLDLLDDPVYMEEQYNKLGGAKLAEQLGVHSTTIYDRLKKFDIEVNKGVSYAEKELFEFVCSLLGEENVVGSDRSVLGGREVDVLIPSLGIGIEYNGLHWHSTARIEDKNYHLKKTNDCKEAGVRLVHIFEDEWVYKNDQVKSMLKNILGVSSSIKVPARKCEVVYDVKRKDVKNFYDNNHIQGDCKQSVTLALQYDGEYVAMVSYRKRSDDEYELIRYATSCNVQGGFSRLLDRSIKELKIAGVKRIVSFADKRYSEGNLYSVNGWFHEGDTRPDYTYVINDTRSRKQNFRRKYLPERINVFDESLSEMQNMIANGIYPIYDCGLMKFSKEVV